LGQDGVPTISSTDLKSMRYFHVQKCYFRPIRCWYRLKCCTNQCISFLPFQTLPTVMTQSQIRYQNRIIQNHPHNNGAYLHQYCASHPIIPTFICST